MVTMNLWRPSVRRYANCQLRTAARFSCALLLACGTGLTARAETPTPEVGNWKWSVSVETKATAFDSVRSSGTDYEREVSKLKDKFERKLRKELGKRCSYSTYDNVAWAGTIDIALTITRDVSVKGNATAVYQQGTTGTVDGPGPDGFPIKPGSTEVVAGTVDQFKDVRLKVKPKDLHIVQIRMRVLATDGAVRDSVDVTPKGDVDVSLLADNLVSAMALLYGKIKP